MSNNRRDFIKQVCKVGGTGLLAASPIAGVAEAVKQEEFNEFVPGESTFTISILQTTDVHCQVHPHDELFWENDKAVFRKTGGYAHLATYIKKEKRKTRIRLLLILAICSRVVSSL